MIIVGSEGCPACQQAKIDYPNAHYVNAQDLIDGIHPFSTIFAAELAFHDKHIGNVMLPILLNDDWSLKC